MKQAFLALPLVVVSFLGVHRPVDSDIEDIEHALQFYLDGHATGDPAIMAQAFHPSARLQFMVDGEYRTRSLDQYLGGLGGSPAADETERRRRVVSIDYVGDAAVGKIELDYPGALITDYMQLLRVDGEWKIVNKIFTVDRR